MKRLCPLSALNQSQEIVHLERLRQEVIEAADIAEDTVSALRVLPANCNEQRPIRSSNAPHGASQFPTSEAWHLNVGHDDVWIEIRNRNHGVLSVVRFPYFVSLISQQRSRRQDGVRLVICK